MEEIEEDFGILISDSVYDDIMILAEDLTFGSGAEKTGSSEFFILKKSFMILLQKNMTYDFKQIKLLKGGEFMVVEIVEQLIKEDGYVFITIKFPFVESVIKCESLALFVIITTELLNKGFNFTITSKKLYETTVK